MKNILQGVAPLAHLGVIRVEGEDASKFLHGQLTQDFALLDRSQARLAAFCSAKGRMQASFIGFKRSDSEILLLCDQTLLANTLQRLSMFVLRAKARLSDARSAYAIYGLAGVAAQSLAGGNNAPWQKTDLGAASVIALYPADGVERALWVAPVGEPAPPGETLNTATWLWSEVRAGIATVTPAIAETFVPQMLNFESVGGVNFKKGCYPGQEVVARSQFRGTLKRRAFLAHCASELQPGHEVFSSNDPSQPCGIVAQAAAAPEGGFDALISIQTTAAASKLTLGQGPVLELLDLPYPLLADI